MKWMGTLKRICRNPRQTSQKSEKVPNKKRLAWQWMYISFFVSMATVAHIFEIPFMIFDPDSFKGPGTGILGPGNNSVFQIANLSGSDSNASLALGELSRSNFGNLSDLRNSSVDNSTTANTILETTTKKAFVVIMTRKMRDDLGFASNKSNANKDDQVHTFPVSRMKFNFLCGLAVGCALMGPMVWLLGRNLTFKLMARTLILFGFLLSISRHIYTAGLCWFMIGVSCIVIYFMSFVNLMEKFALVYEEDATTEETGNNQSRFGKYKYRLYLGIGFTCTWNFSRLYSVLVAWATKDWTLICMWLTLVFTTIYFFFGDFFTQNFEDFIEAEDESKKKDQKKKDSELDKSDDDVGFIKALRTRPILCLNLFILSFNWFACCHNLYGLILGFKKLSAHGNMFDNIAIANGFSFIALPIKFGVCIAARRKLLPYGLLQLFGGIAILVMVAFLKDPTDNAAAGSTNKGVGDPVASGKILAAHIANVLMSAALGILSVITVESFPRKYRMHCFGICALFARLGTILGVLINDLGCFNAVSGPAIAGIMSVMAAVLSRLLPDLTLSRLPISQTEIEMQQFPRRWQEQKDTPPQGPQTA